MSAQHETNQLNGRLIQPDCPKCMRPVFYSNYTVYPDYQQNDRLWHRKCFACDVCGCPLDKNQFTEYKDTRSGRIYSCRYICYNCSGRGSAGGVQSSNTTGDHRDHYCSFNCGPRNANSAFERPHRRQLSPCIDDKVKGWESKATSARPSAGIIRRAAKYDPFNKSASMISEFRAPLPPVRSAPLKFPDIVEGKDYNIRDMYSPPPVSQLNSVPKKECKVCSEEMPNGNSPTFRSPTIIPAKPGCGNCGFPVYFNEKVFSMKTAWHRQCLWCCKCMRKLSPGKHAVKDGLPICHFPCLTSEYSSYQYASGCKDARP